MVITSRKLVKARFDFEDLSDTKVRTNKKNLLYASLVLNTEQILQIAYHVAIREKIMYQNKILFASVHFVITVYRFPGPLNVNERCFLEFPNK